jgi:GntR family transcriptional regulator
MSETATNGTRAMTEPPRSRVDEAESALVRWLSPGRFRAEDRLPPEHDLAAMLGVSRGTLRAALSRLESNGTIRRRRGSGTFVAEPPRAPNGEPRFRAGLEILESYSLLAARDNLALGCEDVRVSRSRAPAAAVTALGLAATDPFVMVERVLTIDGAAAAWMQDVLCPDVGLPSDAQLRSLLRDGQMLLDILRANGTSIGFARTEISARLARPRDRIGRALRIAEPTAVLELTETMLVTESRAVQWSVNLFGPGRLQLHVLRALPPGPPPPLSVVAGQDRAS